METALIDKVAWTSADFLRGPIRGIIVHLAGLGSGMKDNANPQELEWSDAGGLVVNPYHDPWAWMNPATQAFVDDLLDALIQRHQIPANTPVIAIGGSMGGQQALIYTRYSRQHVTACMAICPVCDLPYHYTERPDLPRTLHHAFASYDNIEAALRQHSPLHMVDTMPDVDYLLIHGLKDQAVAKAKHSDPFVAAMRKAGRPVEYIEVAMMQHCNPIDYASYRRTVDFVRVHLSA